MPTDKAQHMQNFKKKNKKQMFYRKSVSGAFESSKNIACFIQLSNYISAFVSENKFVYYI